jgi:hypothetical protein
MASENSVNGLLREQFQAAVGLLEGTMADVTEEAAHWRPAGTANPIGACYAHVLISLDAFVNGMIKEGTPLYVSDFIGKSGLSIPPPASDSANPGTPDYGHYAEDFHAWAHRVTIDLEALRSYGRTVFESVDGWIAGLPEGALSEQVDLSSLGMGQSTVGFLVTNAIVGHAFSHAGEIAALKGLQGMKGFPF